MHGSVHLHVAITPKGGNKAGLPYLFGGQAQIPVPKQADKHRLSVGVSTCTLYLKNWLCPHRQKLALAPKSRVS